MMMNLFSVFDPVSSVFGWPLNWVGMMLVLVILPPGFWLLPHRGEGVWGTVTRGLNREFQILLGKGVHGGTLMLVGLFSFILFNNFLGLFPYVFTSTSHMVVTLALGLPMWVGFMVYGWVNHTTAMLAHLVPQGTPPVLMPFMVIIETISNLIRPGTLAIRLAANMIAGHLLMTLMGNTGAGLGMGMTGFLIGGQLTLLSLESAVAMIQSYVFAVLSTLYAKEVVH